MSALPSTARCPISQPYDAASILAFLGQRAIPGVEHAESNRYRRTVGLSERTNWLDMEIDSAGENLVVSIGNSHAAVPKAVIERAAKVFDINIDAPEMERTLASDPVLDALRMRGLRVAGAWAPFELGVRAILGQQITVAAARTLASRLCERFGDPINGHAPSSLTHTFPTAKVLAEADVAPIGMPQRRAETIRRFSRAVRDREIDLETLQGRQQAPERLLALPGIGKWTVGYFSMRALKDPDAFPSADIALIRAAQRLGIAHDARSLDHAAERWRPWRAYAAVRLWASL